MPKAAIFFYGDYNLRAQFTVKMPKKPQLCLYYFWLNRLAWTISEPHISTSENLHAKQKPFFSAILRAENKIFCFLCPVWKLCCFSAFISYPWIFVFGGKFGGLGLSSNDFLLELALLFSFCYTLKNWLLDEFLGRALFYFLWKGIDPVFLVSKHVCLGYFFVLLENNFFG